MARTIRKRCPRATIKRKLMSAHAATEIGSETRDSVLVISPGFGSVTSRTSTCGSTDGSSVTARIRNSDASSTSRASVKPAKSLRLQDSIAGATAPTSNRDFFPPLGRGPRLLYLYARDKRQYRRRAARHDPLRGTHPRSSPWSWLSPQRRGGCTAGDAPRTPTAGPWPPQTAKLFRYDSRLVLDAGRCSRGRGDSRALYGVTVTLKDPAGKTIEIIPLHTGFREVKIEGGQLF